MCVAGGAYLPVMCDHILMTEGSGLFLRSGAGAGGDRTEGERGRAGGARMHARSAVRWTSASRDEACIARVRSLVEKMGARGKRLSTA